MFAKKISDLRMVWPKQAPQFPCYAHPVVFEQYQWEKEGSISNVCLCRESQPAPETELPSICFFWPIFCLPDFFPYLIFAAIHLFFGPFFVCLIFSPNFIFAAIHLFFGPFFVCLIFFPNFIFAAIHLVAGCPVVACQTGPRPNEERRQPATGH